MPYFLKHFSLSEKPGTARLFLAEGDAEVGFIEAYLTQRNADVSTTTILCFQGLSNVHGHSTTLAKLLEKEGALSRIRGIGLMADADRKPADRMDLVIACAKAFGFPKGAKSLRETGRCDEDGRKFCVALSPTRTQGGTIETLILEEISGSELFKCIGQSFECIERDHAAALTDKAKVQMYISAKGNSSMAGVLHAFRAGLFNPRHDCYKEARAMIDYALG